MKVHVSNHAVTQSQIRQIESDLWDGVNRLRDYDQLACGISGEVNFITRKIGYMCYASDGSNGDLIVIGCDVISSAEIVVKSIFYQCKSQVPSRQARGKQYMLLLGGGK